MQRRFLIGGVAPARRSGARGGLYKLDESHATRWLGFFVFINVFSGSFRWGEDSHESNTPRVGNAAPEGGFPRENILLNAFFRLRGFLFLRVRGYGQTNRAVRYAESYRIARFGFLLLSFPVLRKESGYGRGSAPLHPRLRDQSLKNPDSCRAYAGTHSASRNESLPGHCALQLENKHSPGRLESMADRGVRFVLDSARNVPQEASRHQDGAASVVIERQQLGAGLSPARGGRVLRSGGG